jgi:hypothetical protein
MTVITSVGGRDVFGALARCGPAVVAAGAILWGTFENALDVTGLTIHFDVLAGQRKTGVEMIEVAIPGRLRGNIHGEQQYAENNPLKTSS